MKYVGIIGSRNPSEIQIELCEKWVKHLINKGYGIKSGNAQGIDEIVGYTVNKINPKLLKLYLPWSTFHNFLIKEGNKIVVFDTEKHKDWIDSVYKYHPYPNNLKSTSFKLHARNFGIAGEDNTVGVLAFPGNKRFWGGTGQGMRIAKDLSKYLLVYDKSGNIVEKERI